MDDDQVGCDLYASLSGDGGSIDAGILIRVFKSDGNFLTARVEFHSVYGYADAPDKVYGVVVKAAVGIADCQVIRQLLAVKQQLPGSVV